MAEELYKKFRPTTLKQVIGQGDACKQLIAMGQSGSIPHTILFTGPSGCGKTTLARILRAKLKCADTDFLELNAADSRGIDMVRDIRQVMGLSPLGGDCRIWLIDEVHQLTPAAQDAFLKILEDTPAHVYFFLATTDPGKLKKTILTRSTEIKVRSLSEKEVVDLCTRVHEEECGVGLGEEVAQKLAEVSEGSARKALVLLHQIIGVPPGDQLEILQKADVSRQAIELARALVQGKSWSEVAKLIKAIDEEPESIRWLVLGYCSTVALTGSKDAPRCINLIEEFRFNYYDSKKAGLIASCWRAIKG